MPNDDENEKNGNSQGGNNLKTLQEIQEAQKELADAIRKLKVLKGPARYFHGTLLSLFSFIYGIVFGVGAVLFGTGIGFLVRGQINKWSTKYLIASIFVVSVFYLLNKLLKRKIGDYYLKTRRISWAVGVVSFMSIFFYFVAISSKP